jgi:pimeloyl-ACP methyl ester carboxylesterase
VTLAHDILVAPNADRKPEKGLVFLHGILGTKANLKTIARKFVEARPDWAALLVDLRRHGQSLDVTGPDTLAQAARDVADLASHVDFPVRAVLGHSFGGKVALEWLSTEREHSGLEHVFVLDSNPGPRPDARGSEDTLRVIQMLESLEGPFPSRNAFIDAVLAKDSRRAIAEWLAMNLVRTEDGFVFGPQLPSIRALLTSYFAIDLWPIVESPPDGAMVHLIVGERSEVLDRADRERAIAIENHSGGRVTVDLLNTGHWVHAEDPNGVLRLLVRYV